MQVLEITGNRTGVAKDGVNFLEPSDAYQEMTDGYIYRQVVQSRLGFSQFSLTSVTNNPANLSPDGTRIMGIFEWILRSDEVVLLVASKLFLYTYNPATDLFEQIPFTSAVAPLNGLNITRNQDYVSGTTYPFADGSDRFVFTSKGSDDVWQYDGVGVSRFTNVADNPDYQAPIDIFTGAAGAILNNAFHVIAFGSRINFFSPTINGIEHNDSVLYSAIVDAGGDGDKFASPGSGELQTDSNDFINCATILGDVIMCNFNRSAYVLQKTTDPFNPYFWRKIPSQLGSDAAFSFASYYNQEYAVGNTGLITNDARQQKRFDDAIPYFTRDEIQQDTIQLTYGGFDRYTSQFMFSYAADGNLLNNTQTNVLVYNYEEESFAIYNQRFSVFGQAVVGQSLAWNDIDETHNPSWLQWDTTEEIWNRIGQGLGVQKTLAGDDFGYVYELDQDFDDYYASITGITNAAQAVITTSSQGLMIGDKVSIRDVNGMLQINDEFRDEYDWPIVVGRTATSITVNVDSTLFGVYTGAGSISKIIEFSATTIPFNPYRYLGIRVYVAFVEFLLDTNAGGLFVSVFADGQASPCKGPVRIQPQSIAKIPTEYPVINLNLPFPDATTIYTTDLLTVPRLAWDLPYLKPNSIIITFDSGTPNQTIYKDDGSGTITKLSGVFGYLTGSVDYISGVISIDFGGVDIPGVGVPVIANFTYIVNEYGSDEINDRAWVSMSVDQEADFLTFQMQQQSATEQVRLYSMRIHYSQGGRTGG